MGKAVERIEQEIAALDRAVVAIAQEFHDTYSHYLTALGQAVRQQLILASYHICTHSYPDRFLKLSTHQCQELQQGLRQLAEQAQIGLLEQLQTISPNASPPELPSVVSLTLSDFQNALPNSLSQMSGLSDSTEELELFTLTAPFSEELDPEELDSEELKKLDAEMRSNDFDGTASPSTDEPPMYEQETGDRETAAQNTLPRSIVPRDLARWQERLEAKIIEELQNFSHAANCLLQQAGVLSSRLPEPVLEVAAKADLSSETSASPPNLLNLLVEEIETDENKASTMTQVMAIRLRLSEVEFSDATATVWRSRIRNLSAQLNKLGREYQKKQKEQAIAQAEITWRSNWDEEER